MGGSVGVVVVVVSTSMVVDVEDVLINYRIDGMCGSEVSKSSRQAVRFPGTSTKIGDSMQLPDSVQIHTDWLGVADVLDCIVSVSVSMCTVRLNWFQHDGVRLQCFYEL